MNILIISSILPTEGVGTGNDFVFQTYLHYRYLFPNDSIVIIKPVKLKLNPFAIIKRRIIDNKIKRPIFLNLHNFQIELFAFYSTWSYRNIHALITRTIYYLNKTRIANLLKTSNFDIIHAQYIFPDALLANILHHRFNLPYVITTHNERFYFKHHLSKKIASKILNESSGVFPINHSNYLLYKTIGIRNLELIPLGFSPSFIKKQKRINNGKVSILTVCELIKLKNVDKVIKAVGQLIQKHDIHYTIIGKGKEKNSLIQLVATLHLNDYITFIDQIPYENIAKEMHRHDIFIMPSYFETFGRVYFETMAMGIPIICAKNSGIYGIFKEMKEGISVNHKDISDIVKALEYLLVNPIERHKIGNNGKKLVEKFTWENIAKLLHSKYIKIVNYCI